MVAIKNIKIIYNIKEPLKIENKKFKLNAKFNKVAIF